jgi:type II secretory pathway component PulC
MVGWITLLFSLKLFAAVDLSTGDELGLKLLGTITTGQEGVALVKETATNRVFPLKSGLNFKGGYQVIRVHVKYLMLYRDGTNYFVYEDRFARELSPTRMKQEAVITSGIERDGNQVKIGQSLKDRLINEDLAAVLMQVHASPYTENGKILGWQLFEIDAGSIYDLAGLKDGDIISTVNGFELGNSVAAIRTLRSLKDSTQVRVGLLRGGQVEEIVLDVTM